MPQVPEMTRETEIQGNLKVLHTSVHHLVYKRRWKIHHIAFLSCVCGDISGFGLSITAHMLSSELGCFLKVQSTECSGPLETVSFCTPSFGNIIMIMYKKDSKLRVINMHAYGTVRVDICLAFERHRMAIKLKKEILKYLELKG